MSLNDSKFIKNKLVWDLKTIFPTLTLVKFSIDENFEKVKVYLKIDFFKNFF